MAPKFIFVTGGVVSSLGKGIFASSLGFLLKRHGLSVFMMKFDPYLNVDPGTMSPYQHGEVYVTSDGAETDLDIGHYERWLDQDLTKESSVTSGKVYSAVLEKERRGDYLGACIQVIPHITDEIKKRLYEAQRASNADIVIAEIGGTVGDIESLPFLEAMRQMKLECGYENVLFCHNTLVPYLKMSEESKTKPTQHSVKDLLAIGIQPDLIALRSEVALREDAKNKISLFCNVPKEAVYEALDCKIVYELPLLLHEQGLDQYVLKRLGYQYKEIDLSDWSKMINHIKKAKEEHKKVTIALVGKYVELKDAYLSVATALSHAGYKLGYEVDIRWIKAMSLEDGSAATKLADVDGILVPGGFGERGANGKMEAIKYARENKIPYLGICFGMQLALVEFAHNVLGKVEATSTEFDPHTPYPVIDLLAEQKAGLPLGGTLRLGSYSCELKKGSLAEKCYGETLIKERHRHRYEFNSKFREDFEREGIVISGVNPESGLTEIIELKDHPFFIACQFHPEFTSRPLKPNPLFLHFVEASLKYKGRHD